MFAQCRQYLKYRARESACLIMVVSGVASVPAHAVLTDNLTIGNAKALGLGHAVTADPPGIDSIHYNPAGLVRLRGRRSEVKFITGVFNIELEFGGYTQTWNDTLAPFMPGQEGEADGSFFEDAPEGFLFDESKNSTSETEGAALMLPVVGLTNIPVIAAPLGGASYSPDDTDLTFATNVYSPLMVGFSRADDDPGRFMGEALSFTLITYFSPSVAYKFSDVFSAGASITFNYAGVGLDLPFREPNFGLQWLEGLRQGSCLEKGELPEDGFLEISDFIPCIPVDETVKLYDTLGYLSFQVEKALTFGMNFGVLWEPLEWLHFGAVYQAPISMDMEGDFSWDQGDSLLNFFQKLEDGLPIEFASLGALGSLVEPRTTGTASVKMTMPDHLALGTSIQLTPRFKTNIDYKFTRWSEWADIPVKFSKPIGVIVIANLIQEDAAPDPGGQAVSFPLGLEDTWNLSLGFEYQWSDRLALRLGYEDRPSSIPTASRSPLMPIGDATLWSFGAEYRVGKDSVYNFAIATMSSSVNMPGNTSKLGNSEDYTLFIYNPFSGTDIEANLDVLLFEMSYSTTF